MLSAYETPEIRALFNASLTNVAGKLRTERRWQPVPVPEGVDQVSDLCLRRKYLNSHARQNFIQFECASPKDEADKRFQYFTTQVWSDSILRGHLN